MDRKKAERWNPLPHYQSIASSHFFGLYLIDLPEDSHTIARQQYHMWMIIIPISKEHKLLYTLIKLISQHALSSKTIIMRSNAYSHSLNHCFYFLNWERWSSTQRTKLPVSIPVPLSWVKGFLHVWQKISRA